MVTDKAAFFVEGNGEGTVTGANLQYAVGAFIFSNKIFNKLFGIALALIFRCSGYVFYISDSKYGKADLRHDALGWRHGG